MAVNIFNRAELLMTNSRRRRDELSELLKSKGFDFVVKTVNRSDPELSFDAQRAVGSDATKIIDEASNNYIFYVKKSALAQAKKAMKEADI
jgi:hypothetical protein